MMFPPSYQYFIMVFIGNNSLWACFYNVTNGMLCNSSSTYEVEDSFYGNRCELPQKAWNFSVSYQMMMCSLHKQFEENVLVVLVVYLSSYSMI